MPPPPPGGADRRIEGLERKLEAVFKELSVELDRHLARLAKTLESDVPAFNKLVQDAGLPAIAAGRLR